MLALWNAEPARIVGLVAALVIGSVVVWAPLAQPDKGSLVAALVLIAHELVRSQVTPAPPAPPNIPGVPGAPPGLVHA